MIGRADIEESNCVVAMDAYTQQTSYPYGNFSDTANSNILKVKGSLGHDFSLLCSIT